MCILTIFLYFRNVYLIFLIFFGCNLSILYFQYHTIKEDDFLNHPPIINNNEEIKKLKDDLNKAQKIIQQQKIKIKELENKLSIKNNNNNNNNIIESLKNEIKLKDNKITIK